jgi:glycosyltransferase involved in cell wall biosynthesis
MRVGIDVHTLGRRQTGNETFMRGLFEGLAELPPDGAEYVPYYTGDRAPALGPFAPRRVIPHCSLVRIPLSFPLVFRRDGIDVAHFQYIPPPLCPCPVVLTVPDISYEFHPEYFPSVLRMRMRVMVPSAVRRAAHITTVSQFSSQQIQQRYGVREERITVTSLAAGKAFRPPAEGADPRGAAEALGIRGAYILAVGNLQPRKNLARIVSAYAALRRGGALAHRLVLVGPRSYGANEFLERVRQLGLESDITITGYVTDEQLVGLYQGADVFVYASLYEGFGLPIVEAMACGAPVIASNVASMPEVAGDAALLVDPRSESELSAALLRLGGSSAEQARLRAKGYARAAHFTWRRMAEATREAYRRCA